MRTVKIKNKLYSLRIAEDCDVSVLRKLVNVAYKELSDRGWNYTATYQDDEKTRERIKEGRAFLLIEKDEIIASILFFEKNYFTNTHSAYVGQFAVLPKLKKQGFGTFLMDYCESLAQLENYDSIQLDTAKPALHLVNWYLRRGYKIVGETHWEGKTYDSYIFEKSLRPS